VVLSSLLLHVVSTPYSQLLPRYCASYSLCTLARVHAAHTQCESTPGISVSVAFHSIVRAACKKFPAVDTFILRAAHTRKSRAPCPVPGVLHYDMMIMRVQSMRTTVADGPAQPAQNGNIKSAVEAKVNEQYDSDASMAFYEHVMGGGGDDIHYGIFRSEQDGLKQSSQNSVEQLAKMAEECGALKKVRSPSWCSPGTQCVLVPATSRPPQACAHIVTVAG
jgi:hypothetical protein